MKISFKGDYALKIVLDLSLHYNVGSIQLKDIAKRQDIPLKYLQQICLILKGAGYIRTKRGIKGGVCLAKKPSDITIGEIIRLLEGPTSPITCVSKSAPVKCNYDQFCPFIPIWIEIRTAINKIVDFTTFQDMVEKSIALRNRQLNYAI